MARIIQAPAAEADAVEIWAYIAQDNIEAADRLLQRFDQLFRLLASQPFLGKSVGELGADLRLVPLGS